jgi:RNA polymerase sigma factor (sigma-70 family)
MKDASADRRRWFRAVVLPHEATVRARLRRLCPPGFDVENLIAESLCRAYAATEFERINAGRSYLFTIARNLLLDAMRRETIVPIDFVADLDILADDSLEASLTARDELRRLLAAVETLPPQCRRAFVLRRVYGHSPREIAVQMGLSVSTVEKHLARGISLLVEALGNAGDQGRDERGEPARPSRPRRAGGRLPR